MRLGLGRQLTVIFLAITFAVAGTAGYVFLGTFRQNLLDERSVALITQANIIASGVAPLLGDDAAVEEFLQSRSREVGARLLVLTTGGRVVADSSAGSARYAVSGRLSHPLVEAALAGVQESAVHRLADGQWTMYVAVPVVRRGSVNGVLFVASAVDDIAAGLTALATRLALYLGASGILVTLATLAVAQRLTAPLGHLTRAAERLGNARLSERVDIRRRDELGLLGQAFNRMAEQLEQVDRSRRRFIGDASHEMRTPLSAIKIMVESLLAQETYEPAETQELLRGIDGSVERLARLVEGLLVLMRLEHDRSAGEAGRRRRPILLSELAGAVVTGCGPLAAAREVSLGVAVPPGLQVPGDDDALYRALVNLVENAIRYTPPGGSVSIEAAATGDEIRLAVRDTGTGIAAADLPHVFDRFYRPDSSRSRDGGGFGLGLAIVRETAALHGGRIGVTSKPGEGSVFVMNLPAR